jgi:hypothetical protein
MTTVIRDPKGYEVGSEEWLIFWEAIGRCYREPWMCAYYKPFITRHLMPDWLDSTEIRLWEG